MFDLPCWQVMNIGLTEEARSLIRAAHADALKRGLYPCSCYMGSNADEYMAEAHTVPDCP